MNRDVDRWIINYLIRPPLVLLRFVLSPIYDFLFGWLDRHSARNDQRKLEQDVRSALPFLFAENHGQIVMNDGVAFPPPFNYAYVTVAVDNLLIRFFRGRGDIDVRIASKDAPNTWHELCLVLSLLEKNENLQRWSILDLRDASRLLEPYVDRLKAAFASDSGQDLKQRLGEVYAGDKVAIREAEWEINKRLSRP